MKKFTLPALALALFFSSCQKNSKDELPSAESQQPSQLQSTQQINAFIRAVIQTKGEFDWKEASDLTLYSAIMHSDDHMVSVGYKPSDEQNVEERLAKIDIRDPKWLGAKMQVLQLILQQEKLI